ncbi:hypothetical protein LCGC14_1363570, partial [marine sediment metagenome]
RATPPPLRAAQIAERERLTALQEAEPPAPEPVEPAPPTDDGLLRLFPGRVDEPDLLDSLRADLEGDPLAFTLSIRNLLEPPAFLPPTADPAKLLQQRQADVSSFLETLAPGEGLEASILQEIEALDFNEELVGRVEASVQTVFSVSIDELSALIEQNPDAVLDRIEEIGANDDTLLIVNAMGLSQEEIVDLFVPPEQQVIDIPDFSKLGQFERERAIEDWRRDSNRTLAQIYGDLVPDATFFSPFGSPEHKKAVAEDPEGVERYFDALRWVGEVEVWLRTQPGESVFNTIQKHIEDFLGMSILEAAGVPFEVFGAGLRGAFAPLDPGRPGTPFSQSLEDYDQLSLGEQLFWELPLFLPGLITDLLGLARGVFRTVRTGGKAAVEFEKSGIFKVIVDLGLEGAKVTDDLRDFHLAWRKVMQITDEARRAKELGRLNRAFMVSMNEALAAGGLEAQLVINMRDLVFFNAQRTGGAASATAGASARTAAAARAAAEHGEIIAKQLPSFTPGGSAVPGQAETLAEIIRGTVAMAPDLPPAVPPEGAPLLEALVKDAESLLAKAKEQAPENALTVEFETALEKVRVAPPEAKRQALIEVESLEGGIRELIGEPAIVPETVIRLPAAEPAVPTPVPPEPAPVTPEPVTPALTPEENEQVVTVFGNLLADPSRANFEKAQQLLRTEELAGRAAQLKPLTAQFVTQGFSVEEALKKSEQALKGPLRSVQTFIPDLIDTVFRPALFSRIDEKLTGFERAATRKALENALAGKPIPSKPGTKGGSALSRLQVVFPKEIIGALQTPGGLQAFLLDNLPQPIGVSDAALRDYLRTLSPSEQGVLGFDQPVTPRLGDSPWTPPPSPRDPRPLSQRILDFTRLRRAAGLLPKGVTQRPEFPPSDAALREIRGQQRLDEPAWIPPDPLVTMTEAERTALTIDIRNAMGQVPRGISGVPPEFPPGQARELALFPSEDRGRLWNLLKDTGMTVVDFFNFIRAVRASFDLSAWRQMSPLIFGNLTEFMVSNAEMFRAAWTAEHAKTINDTIQHRPEFVMYDKLNLDFLRPFDLKAVEAWKKTEEFIIQGKDTFFGRLADKMPFIRISSRAHITFTNKMSFDIWARYIRDLGGVQAVLADPELLDTINKLGKMLAEMSGRGPLGPFKSASQVINAGVFAARFTTGRLFAPRWLVSSNPYVRKQAWKNWLTFIGGFAGIISLGVAMGLWETESDPRNPDFMKMRIGNTRIDPWGGQQQVVVLFSRLISGEQISSTTGMKRDVDLLDTLQHWSRGKASPLGQWLLDATTGKTFLGEELDLSDPKQWMDRIAPFALLDIYEAFEEEGMAGVFWGALPAIFGANVQSYGSDYFGQFKDKLGTPVAEGDPVPEVDGKPVSIEDQPFYTMATYFGDINRRIVGVPTEEITVTNFPPEWVHAAETRDNRVTMNGLSNVKPINLNTDPALGNSLEEFKLQGDLIARESDLDLKTALRLEFPNAITGIMRDNLIEYH